MEFAVNLFEENRRAASRIRGSLRQLLDTPFLLQWFATALYLKDDTTP